MRVIQPELFSFIRTRIPLLTQEMEAAYAHDLFQMAYHALEGIREKAPNRGHLVNLILNTIALPPGQPWCMAAAQSAIAFVEGATGVKSPIPSGGHCLTVFNESPDECRLHPPMIPAPGDLMVFRHGGTENGHTEGVMGVYKDRFAYTVGGNTSEGPGIERDGDGVYHRMRAFTGTPALTIHGFLRVFP